ncbi:hypothetical protein [Psychrobacter sp. FDAARGOS_221]|uniref:hypothetical protein n=1 Tax=Psychrobacter sp. FDAARGOS_221 TaxID=1975705 RepID=UPI000BB588B8|nr:hypothetical protein [Psychrobacter sp. FDAARGOS_221]PNK61174.1 hypothetical protein A6J60_010035 [Psychrobacter sp. FDAARGOS_221]
MRYSKLIKLGTVAAALLLIPRRSSRRADQPPQSRNPNKSTKTAVDADKVDNTASNMDEN